MICDFHTHSTFSDGTFTPAELIDEARRTGVGCLALTDHDDVAGIPEALEHAARVGVELVPGVEISVSEEDGARQMHVLGLAVDAQAPELARCLREMQGARRARLGRILDRLADAGVELDRRVFDALPDAAAVGRPHVARALVEAGLCKDEDEAFSRWLRRGRPAYVGSAGIGAPEAIRVIHDAGGMAALAHPPLSVGADAAGGLAAFVERLVRLGLDGLEVQHPGHQPTTRRRLRKLARSHGLVTTGGSDFHGAARPDVALGRGRGSIDVDERTRDAILERAERYR